MKRFLYIVIFSFITISSYAQVYKWVDEQGKTHFSQTPPPVEEKATIVEKIGRSGALLKVEPEKNGHYYYCGSLKMLSDFDGDDILHENIKLSLQDWEAERNELQAVLELSNESGKKWNSRKIKQQEEKLARYNCRVNWGYEKLKEFESFGYKARKTNNDLETRYKSLKQLRDEECPADAKRFGSILVGDAARKWHDCYQGYSREMKSIRKMIKENRRSAREASK